MSQLKLYYNKEVVPKLLKTFKYDNIMQVPKLEKIVLNMGLGEAIHNIKLLDSALEELKIISGQQPVVTRARKSIAAFKLREGMPIVILEVFREKRLMVTEIIRWELKSTLFFLKSITIKSIESKVLTLR
jgi:large subunit ribosomal protein L5